MSMVAPTEGRRPRPFYDLAGFARLFLRTHSIRRHQDVRTEVLAEAFRHHMNLAPFPTLGQLQQLCQDLEIELDELPKGSPLPGANTSYGTNHAIFLRSDLPTKFTETTLGHELREVIEQALQRADQSYNGLDTSHNKKMHPESEFFALCLLMQADATHQRLHETGFDLARFAEERERSLPSVIMRLQTMYSVSGGRPGPVCGIWLFSATSGPRPITPATMKVRQTASLCGFSTDKSGPPGARRANALFPRKNSPAKDFDLVLRAVEERQPTKDEVSLLDLWNNEVYLVVADPIFSGDRLRRVLVTAVRRDFLQLVEPWLDRLGLAPA